MIRELTDELCEIIEVEDDSKKLWIKLYLESAYQHGRSQGQKEGEDKWWMDIDAEQLQ